jgi:hypothetical protein
MRGGKREGAGRKTIHSAPLKTKSHRLTDQENALVKEYIKKLREEKKND